MISGFKIVCIKTVPRPYVLTTFHDDEGPTSSDFVCLRDAEAAIQNAVAAEREHYSVRDYDARGNLTLLRTFDAKGRALRTTPVTQE